MDAILTWESDNGNITFDDAYGAQSGGVENYGLMFVNTWAANETSAVATITLTYATKVYTKKFSISSTSDAPGAIILDIDATGGFNWTPQDRTDKTVNGNLYDSNILQTSGYVYRWSINGTPTSLPNLGTPTSAFHADNREVTIARTLVASSATILCETYPSAETPAVPIQDTIGFRGRAVKFTDVLDNQSKIAWTDYTGTTNADKIPDGTDPASLPVTPDTAVWYLSTNSYWETHQAEFQCFAEETDSGWVWTYPQDFRGEQGSQGPNGDYYFNMYMANPTQPLTPNYLTTTMLDMRSLGWEKLPQTVGIVWQTRGRFNGETDPPLGDGYPQNSALSEDVWGTPVKLTGTDGVDGNPGTSGIDGDKGWSPSFAVVTDGDDRDVMQLVDWVGGAGSKPAIGDPYVGPSGMVATKGAAQNIKGQSIRVQVGGATWTQGGPTDGDIWINKV